MLNRRGGIECDFTVARLAEDRFWIVTGTAFGSHDLRVDRSHAGRRRAGRGRHLALGLRRACGARGRATSSPPPAPTTSLDFRYMTRASIAVGDVPVRALRVTYVGELGWELYCPMEFGAALWRTLWEAGEPHGLVAGGYRAIDSLRLEKGYRVWGADITPDETPYEGGLGFAVKLDKDVHRPRRARRRRSRRGGCAASCSTTRARWRSATSRCGSGGEIVGRVTSGGYGYTVGARSPTPTCPPSTPSRAPRWRSRCSASGSTARCAAEPLFDPDGRTRARLEIAAQCRPRTPRP